MHGSRRARGFTIIELLMVLILIGVLAAFAAPRIDLIGHRANGAMQGVGTTLLAAQRLALTRQHDVVVVFDDVAGVVRVHDDGNDNGVVDAGEHVSVTPLGDLVVFGLGGAPPLDGGAGAVTFTRTEGGRPAVTFHRSGSASESGVAYLTSRRAMANSGFAEDTRAIQVERATGRASWYRYRPSGWQRGF